MNLILKNYKSHSKTSNSFLHLETGTIPIKFIISSRRLNFLHNILKRNENETIVRVLNAQKENPINGDFIKLIKQDFTLIDKEYDERLLKSMNKKKFKIFIKKKIKESAFKFLVKEKSDKSKVKDIEYNKFEIQKYIVSKLFTNYEVELLQKIRSRNLDVKCNFKTRYSTFLECSLDGCSSQLENQPHLMKCKPIMDIFQEKFTLPRDLKYEHIFSKNVKKQKTITKLFSILLDIREQLLKKQSSS